MALTASKTKSENSPVMFILYRLVSIALAVGFAFALASIASPNDPILGPRLLILASLYVTLAVGLNLINGITGQFSIGHAGFYMCGAYAAGLLSRYHYDPKTMPIALWIIAMIVVGFIVSALAGLLVGIPSLRLKGDYLAIVTLGFGEIIRISVGTQQGLGGTYGLEKIPSFISRSPMSLMVCSFLLAMIAIAVSRNLLKTHHGLPFLAVRDDEIASRAMGINTTSVKVSAFVIGSAFAGAAGAIFAMTEAFISPKAFTMNESFIVLTMVVLGGTGSITGSAIAAILLFYLPELLRNAGSFSAPVFAGAILAAVVGALYFKKFRDENHVRPGMQFWIRNLGLILGTGIVTATILMQIPNVRATQYDSSQMRMVIFSITLVLLMLVRKDTPGKAKEFSWDGLQNFLPQGEKK